MLQKKTWPQSELGSTPICFYPRSNDGHVFEQAFRKLGGGGGRSMGGCSDVTWDITWGIRCDRASENDIIWESGPDLNSQGQR